MQQSFHCPLQASFLLLLWMGLALGGVLVTVLGGYTKTYFRWGPSESLVFLGTPVDTWEGYAALMSFSVVTQVVKVYADELISPFILNTVMDHKEPIIEKYGYWDILFVTQVYYIFSALVSLVQVAVAISQVDVAVAYVLADAIVSLYTTRIYLKDKAFVES